MDFLLGFWFFLLGLIVGSFLNVVIYRLHTGRGLSGRSHCLSCGGTLLWRHLIPLFSYLWLRGRCAHCGSHISPRYLVVELLTALLFLFAYVMVVDAMLLPLYLALLAVCVVIVVYDIFHTIIPDEYVVMLGVVALSIGGYEAMLSGTLAPLVPRVLSALVAFLFFASLWFISGGRWIGFGDAKLAVPLGFLLSWPAVFSGIIISFWIGAATSLVLLTLSRLLPRGQISLRFLPSSLTIKSEVPFAPFLVAGSLLTHFFGIDAFTLIGNLIY